MSNQNSQFGIKEVMNLTVCEYAVNSQLSKPIVVIDYAQVTGLEHSSDRIFINGGRGNKKLLGFDHSKAVTLKLSLPLVDFKLLSKITGDDIQNKIAKMFKAETKMVKRYNDGNYIVLEKEPLDNTLFVNMLSGYRELEDNLIVVPNTKTPNDKECSVVIENGEVRLYVNADTCPEGSEIRVHYTHQSVKETQKIVFSADKFPKYVTLKGDTLFKNQVTTEDEVYNFIGYKCQFQGNFTLNMSATDPTVLELTVDLYAHKDKETQEEMYYEFIKEESDDVLGTFTFTNIPNPVDNGILLTVGGGDYILGLAEENVVIIPEPNKENVFTIKDYTITPVGAGSGKITLKKINYQDTEINITVEATVPFNAKAKTTTKELKETVKETKE